MTQKDHLGTNRVITLAKKKQGLELGDQDPQDASKLPQSSGGKNYHSFGRA